MAGNNNLELEIHSLFIEGSTPDHICNEILSKYEKNEVLSPAECEGLSHFFLSAGRIDLLFQFYQHALKKESMGVFPWGYLATALKQTYGKIPEEILDLIDLAFEQNQSDTSALRMDELKNYIPSLINADKKKTETFLNQQLEIKNQLITQLNHNRLYQLHEQEEVVLNQLVKKFPNDLEVRLLHQAHLEKKADEILSRVRSQNNRLSTQPAKTIFTPEEAQFIEELKVQIEKLAIHYKENAPEQIYNLALLCMNFELYDFSYDLLMQSPETHAGEWLKAEILFESGRHLDLLKHIEQLEVKMTTSPDSTYGAIYLKAQAYFALGQKDLAIQMLEALSQAHPSYRSTEALLHQWRTI